VRPLFSRSNKHRHDERGHAPMAMAAPVFSHQPHHAH